jgi:alpha-L-fucosidase
VAEFFQEMLDARYLGWLSGRLTGSAVSSGQTVRLALDLACRLVLIGLLGACRDVPEDIPRNDVVPTKEQLEYEKMELLGFVHFGVNTFTDSEWGYGDESPDVFGPMALDPGQWASVAAEVGMKELILTAKHHDGFCLWPSRYTEHSVKSSAWRDGAGDVVRDFVSAARQRGVKVGLYLSPWDRNHADYGGPAYIEYYRSQLRELLTGYGTITEIWFDGANGGDGYYGGADEERRIDRESYYRWSETWALVKALQPGILIFSDAGPDIRWIGNERGFAGVTNWSMINTAGIVVGAADAAYLNTGDPLGTDWVVPLCNTSIRPGWFYHAAEDSAAKTAQQLLEVYYRSVGRNCVLLLNVPPDRRGLFHENDVAVLREFRRILDETFRVNLALNKAVTADSHRESASYFAPSNVVDDDADSYWAAEDGVRQATLEVDLGKPTYFDRIMLQEPIRFGQRVAAFAIEAFLNGGWSRIAGGTTIGYKRLLRIGGVETDRIRIIIEQANNVPALSNFGLFEASPAEAAP